MIGIRKMDVSIRNRVAAIVLSFVAGVAVADPLLAPIEVDVARVTTDSYAFADRRFKFSAETLSVLKDKKYFLWTYNESPAHEILREGDLFVITPSAGEKDSHADELAKLGFAKAARDGMTPFVCDGKPAGKAEVWRKFMRKGERLPKFWPWAIVAGFDDSNQPWKWSPEADAKRRRVAERIVKTAQSPRPLELLINKPDYIVFVPEQPQLKKHRRADRVGDTYNDHFHVLYDEVRRILYAFWVQASNEGDIDEHIAFSKSRDQGATWTKPQILAGSMTRKNPQLRACWQQPMLSKSGRLYCFWAQTGVRPGCVGYMYGIYSDDCGESWSVPEYCPFPERSDKDPKNPMEAPCWLNWQRPLRLGKGGRYLAAVSRWGWADYENPAKDCQCVVDFMQYDNIDENPRVRDVKVRQFALNEKALRVPKTGKFNPICEEGSIVKLPDGRLFCLMRSSIGHPVWSQSRDDGVTWTQPQILRRKDGGEPFLHPQSPCPMYDWKGCEAASGTYFALIHNKFDFRADTPMQRRTELYLIAGRFNPKAKNQPVEFAEPKMFAPRPGGNSFYTSYCVVDGKGILWFPDMKYYLLGRIVGPEWFAK